MIRCDFIAVALVVGLMASATRAEDKSPTPAAKSVVLNEAYPGLASGALTYARAAELAPGMLIRAGGLSFSENDLADALAKAPPRLSEQLRKNAFFLAENMFARLLVLQLAKEDAVRSQRDISNADDSTVVQGFFAKLTEPVKVTDREVSEFYKANKDMFGGEPLDKVKEQLAPYLLGQKRQEVVMRYVETLGRLVTIEVSASWAKEQTHLANDNPVGKARASGRPTLVEFGAKGCGPCDMMAPILETLRKKYEGKANVLFVHVGEEEILAARYGIEPIPVQVFFDKDGKEVFRHMGFFPQKEVEKKMAEAGVR